MTQGTEGQAQALSFEQLGCSTAIQYCKPICAQYHVTNAIWGQKHDTLDSLLQYCSG